jgi:hypothetical protein
MVQREELEAKLLQGKILVFLHTFKFKSVQGIVDAIKNSNDGVTIGQIKDAMLELERDRKIDLRNPAIQGSFSNYVSKDLFTALPLWLSLIGISLSLLTFYVIPDVPLILFLRAIVAIGTILVLPGYGLISLILSSREISLLERVGLSLMLSLAIVGVLWITLDQLHVGADTNLVLLSALITGTLLVTAGTYKQFLREKEIRI